MLLSTGCYKLANLLKNCIDLYYGKSVGCAVAGNNVVNSNGIDEKEVRPDYSAWQKIKREIYVEQALCEGLELNFIESLDNPHQEKSSIFRGFAE